MRIRDILRMKGTEVKQYAHMCQTAYDITAEAPTAVATEAIEAA